jgi:hypothetical protein
VIELYPFFKKERLGPPIKNEGKESSYLHNNAKIKVIVGIKLPNADAIAGVVFSSPA